MKKLLFFVATLFFATRTFAQVDEVTITVLGTGVDEEQATLQALRSAIEQTFGAFVSANTTILNDSLIQDEIVSVSTGNVKKYEKIAVATMPNGHVSVSLTATVSVNKLIAFAESKGAKAEFAGSVYAANVKLTRLKMQSTRNAYNLMMKQMEHIAKDMFDFKFEIADFKRTQSEKLGDVYYFNCYIGVVSNSASAEFCNLYTKTIKELSLTDDDILSCQRENIEFVDYRKSPNTFAVALPFSDEEYEEFKRKLFDIIREACHRYVIREIDNPDNKYYFRPQKDVEYVPNAYLRNNSREFYDAEYFLYSERWKHLMGNGLDSYCRKEQKVYEFVELKESQGANIWHDFFSPIWFSLMTLNDEYDIINEFLISKLNTNTISFSGPNLICVQDVCVAIPASAIENFKGFELVGVSAPTDTLSAVSQAYWEGVIGNRKGNRGFVPEPVNAENPTMNSQNSHRSSSNPARSSSISNTQNSSSSRTTDDNNSYRRSSSSYRSYGTYPRRYGF